MFKIAKSKVIQITIIFMATGNNIFLWGDDSSAKLHIMGENWKKSAVLDQKQYEKQMEQIAETNISAGIIPPTKDELNKVSNILWPDIEIKKDSKHQVELERLDLKSDAIFGYRHNAMLLDQHNKVGKNPDDVRFFVNTSLFNKPIELSSRSEKNGTEGCIWAHIINNNIPGNERTTIFSKILFAGSREASDYLSLYEITNGPGDACLVSVIGSRNRPGEKVLSDDRIVFVRGNITVYLVSSYENFGCMDLACRIDAFLDEQMKKQKKGEIKNEQTD